MSHSNYTRNILNIKDENIIFDENCLEENIIKYGFKKNCKVKIDKVSNLKTLLLLDK